MSNKRGLLPGRASAGVETLRTSLTFEKAQWEQIEALASERRVSVGWVIRDALQQYLSKHLKEARMSTIDQLRDEEIHQRPRWMPLFFKDYSGVKVNNYEGQIAILLAHRATLYSERLAEDLKHPGYQSTMRNRLLENDNSDRADVDAVLERALPLCDIGLIPAACSEIVSSMPLRGSDGKATIRMVDELRHALPHFAIGKEPSYDVDGPAGAWLSRPVVRDKLYSAIFQ